MKKMFVKVLNAGLLLLSCIPIAAQDENDSLDRVIQSYCQSEWTKYNNLTGVHSIVRSNASNHVVYVQEKEKVHGMNRHTFIVRGYTMSPWVAFSTVFNDPCDLDCIGPSVEIYDMRLFEGSCYFCGKITQPCPDFMGNRFTDGFVGRFSMNAFLDGSGTVYYYKVDEVTQLTRLAITKVAGSVLTINAIGNMEKTRNSCIVELTDSGAVWGIRLDTINNTEKVVFSDIMAMQDSLTLLAQYACENDELPGSNSYDNSHQVFLLDRFDLRGCFYTCGSPGFHHMAFYVMATSENCFFHHDRAPMRLFHINDESDKFGVAFGVEESEENIGGVRLFLFSHAWEYDSCIYYRTDVHAEVKDIGNLFNTNKLFVLSRDNAHTNGLIAIPSLGGAAHNVTWLTNVDYTYNSLTQRIGGNDMDISCHDNFSNFHLFDQDIQLLPQESCFTKSVHQYEVLPKRHAVLDKMEWGFSKKTTFRWEVAEISMTQLSLDVICSFCE